MSGSARFRQDMPPPGGYASVEWTKRVRKGRLSGNKFFGMIGAMIGCSMISLHFDVKRRRMYQLEQRDAEIALEPLLRAERHRAFLRQLRQNRDYENEVMSEVPGWVTGTLWGERLYSATDRFPDVSPTEYYMFNSESDLYGRMSERWRH